MPELVARDLDVEEIPGEHQRVDVGLLGVRITHTPSGIFAESRAGRSQLENRAIAIRTLRRRLDPVDAAAVVDLGRLALDFGRVDRVTYHPDGATPESDTDHTVMLGLVAAAFAARHLPELDVGLVACFALVHDLGEVYAGDVSTLRAPSAAQRADKADREAAAANRIDARFAATLEWLPDLICRYEARREPEARYVRAMDKLLPKITHILNGGVTIIEQGMSREDLAARYDDQVAELRAYAADFPALFDLRTALVATVFDVLDEGMAAIADAVAAATEHLLVRKPPGGGGGHTPGVGWMCTGCGWRFSYDVPQARAREVWLDDDGHRPEAP